MDTVELVENTIADLKANPGGYSINSVVAALELIVEEAEAESFVTISGTSVHNTLQVIKSIRECTGLGLREAKEKHDELKRCGIVTVKARNAQYAQALRSNLCALRLTVSVW